MPAKKGKKAGGGGTKKKKKAAAPATPFVYLAPDVHDLGIQQVEYVSLSVKMAELVHLGFEWPLVPTIVTIASLKEAIRKRHGGTIMDVILYKDKVLPTSRVQGNPETLADLGVKGGTPDDPSSIPQVAIFYDFPLVDIDCPLLLAPPHEEARRYPPPPPRQKSPDPRGRRGSARRVAGDTTPRSPRTGGSRAGTPFRPAGSGRSLLGASPR